MTHKLPVEHYVMLNGQRRELTNAGWEYYSEGVRFYGELEIAAGDVVVSVIATPFAATLRRELAGFLDAGTLEISHKVTGADVSAEL